MSTYSEFAEAFTIFAKYEDLEYGVSAEHGVIYAGPELDAMSADDIARLRALRWHYSDSFDCWCTFT